MAKYFKMAGFILLFLIVYYVAQIAVTGIFSVFYFVGEIAGNNGVVDQNMLTEGVMKDLNVILILAILVSFPLYMFICWIRNQSLFKVCEFVGTGFKNIALSAVAGISTSIFFGVMVIIPKALKVRSS